MSVTETACHCGKPLHYKDPARRAVVEKLVAELGSHVPIRCGGRAWLVPRHYVALHGLKAADLPTLGFEEIHER